MKKFMILGMAALMALSTVAIGAEGDDKPAKKRPDAKKARDGKARGDVFSKLDLSAEQKEKIGEIRKEFGAKFKEARENKDREAFGKLRKEMMDAVLEVLTDEQKEKLKAARDRRGDGGPDKGKRPGKGKRPAKKAE